MVSSSSRRRIYTNFRDVTARRYEKGSTMITTNQAVIHWGTVFGDEVIAAAILDRLLHHSHVMTIQGDSYRLKQKRKAGLLGTTKTEKDAERRGSVLLT